MKEDLGQTLAIKHGRDKPVPTLARSDQVKHVLRAELVLSEFGRLACLNEILETFDVGLVLGLPVPFVAERDGVQAVRSGLLPV